MVRSSLSIVWVAAIAALSACSKDASTQMPTATPPTTPSPTVTSVSVAGTAPVVGATAQFTATASLSNGTTQNVTSQATWQSSSPSVATVNSAGVVSAIDAGDVDITAIYQTVTGRTHISIGRPAPAPAFNVSGSVTDGTSGGVLPGIAIAASNGKTATTDTLGNYSITGVAAGTLSLTASASGYQSTSKTTNVTANTRVDFVLARATPAPAPPGPTPIGEPGLPPRTAVGSAFRCELSAIVHPAACVNSMFGDATAICGDGARSCSTNNSGTCSSHMNVYCFVCPGVLCPALLAPAPAVAPRQ